MTGSPSSHYKQPCLLKKVISGGQTGADQAGIYAARATGLKTGGMAPRGWKTLDGPNAELGIIFGLEESKSEYYSVRTAANVSNPDGTIRIASNWHSRGEVCTQKAVFKYNKPCLDIMYFEHSQAFSHTEIEIIEWLTEHEIEILNVAGNSEKTAPGIRVDAQNFLMGVFNKLKGDLK